MDVPLLALYCPRCGLPWAALSALVRSSMALPRSMLRGEPADDLPPGYIVPCVAEYRHCVCLASEAAIEGTPLSSHKIHKTCGICRFWPKKCNPSVPISIYAVDAVLEYVRLGHGCPEALVIIRSGLIA